jgi:hypothetical protein
MDSKALSDLEEIVDRVRRIETMLFKVALALNVNPRTGGRVSDEKHKLE